MQWVFGTDAPDGMRKRRTHHHPEVPQKLVPVSSQVSHIAGACERRRDSTRKSALHQQKVLLRTVLPNSLFMCQFVWAESHAEKVGCGWGRRAVPWLLCSSVSIHLHFSMKTADSAEQAHTLWLCLWGTALSQQPCTAAQPLHHMLHLRQLPVWTTNAF